jgi:hypothetical protein
LGEVYAANPNFARCPGEVGVPAVEVVGELVVEDSGADLQQRVSTAWGPAHLLLLTMRLLITWLTADSVNAVDGDALDGLQAAEDVAVPEEPLQPFYVGADLSDQLGGRLGRQLQVRIRRWRV